MIFLKGSMQSPTHFLFREDNFPWSPPTNQTVYMYFVTLQPLIKKIIRLWWRSCTESFNYCIKSCRRNQLQCTDQGAKKVGFTACHSGKLLLVCTSPRVFQVARKKLFDEQHWLQFFCNLNFPKELHLPFKLRTGFPSPVVKSTSPGLSDTTFFARCRYRVTTKIGADNHVPFFHHFQSVSCHPCEL